MSKRRIGDSGDVFVYINEQADVAVLTLPVRDLLMVHALIGLTGGDDLNNAWRALDSAIDPNDDGLANKLYSKYRILGPRIKDGRVVMFDANPTDKA